MLSSLGKIKLRRVAQIIIVLFTLYLAFLHQKFGIERAASIDAYCPFGFFEGILTYISNGEFLKRLYYSSFVFGLLVVLFTIVFGRVFCGFFCPLGAIQEWLRLLGRKIGLKRDFELPEQVDKLARYVKYLVLVVVVVLSWKLGDLVFRNYDPFNALAHLGNEVGEKVVGYSLLGIIILISLVTKNWWCRYLCPLGAALGIFKKVGAFKIKRDETTCIQCNLCNKICPAGLKIKENKVTDEADCISCGDCVTDCPKDSLMLSWWGKKFEIKKFIWIVVVAFLVSLSLLVYSPIWKTKAPSNLIKSNGAVDVENIRGSNTLESLVKVTGISLDEFKNEFNLPADVDKTIMLKSIGSTYGLSYKGEVLETEHFREFIENKLQTKK